MAVIRVDRSDGGHFSIDFEQVGEFTRHFIYERLQAAFPEEQLTDLVSELLQCMGYTVRWFAPANADSASLVATTDPLGLNPRRAKVQVRLAPGLVGKEDLRRFATNLAADDLGIVVTLGGFTSDAEAYAETVGLQLMRASALVDLILEHYDRLDAPTRARIPLRPALIP